MMGPLGPGAACCRRLPVPLGVAVFTSTRLPQTSCMLPCTNTASTDSSFSNVINLREGAGVSVCVCSCVHPLCRTRAYAAPHIPKAPGAPAVVVLHDLTVHHFAKLLKVLLELLCCSGNVALLEQHPWNVTSYITNKNIPMVVPGAKPPTNILRILGF